MTTRRRLARVHHISPAQWEMFKRVLVAKGWRIRTWTPDRTGETFGVIYRTRKKETAS